MADYKLDATFEEIGVFWEPHSVEETVAGTLCSAKGCIHLQVAPSARKMSHNDYQELISNIGESGLATINCLNGILHGDKVTLCGLIEANSGGQRDLINKIAIDADRWRAKIAIRGVHLESIDDQSLTGAAFYFSKITHFLPSSWQMTINTDNETVSYWRSKNSSELFAFHCNVLDAKIALSLGSASSARVRRINLRSFPHIRVIPTEPKSLGWFEEVSDRVENFFTLFMGTSVNLDRFLIEKGQDRAWIIARRIKTKEKVKYDLIIRCEMHQLAAALNKWLAMSEAERPVEQTLLGVVRNTKMFTETQFLSLAQALEGFGRIKFKGTLIDGQEFDSGIKKLRKAITDIWKDEPIARRCIESMLHANEEPYGQRIRRAYGLLSPEFSMSLLGDVDEFVRKVVHSRNYYTHLGIPKTKYVLSGKELFLLNQKISAFLRCVLLQDLGVSESTMRDAISYQATRWS